MHIETFVPIKLRNTRLPGKNIKDFGGKPLCWRIFDTLLEAGLKPYVFCSDKEIMKYVPNGVKFLRRSTGLDKDDTNATELTKAFHEQIRADVYVQAYCTAPFLRKETVLKGIERMNQNDSALTVRKAQTWVWQEGKPLNFNPSKIMRSQDMNPLFIETTGLYIYNSEIGKTGRRTGFNPYFLEVDHIEGVDIDNQNDFDFAQKLRESYHI